MARKPILDLHGRVHAYQLQYRNRPGDEDSTDWSLPIVAAHLGLEKPSELKKLTGKLKAMVRIPIGKVSEQLAQLLPPSLTILELSAPSQPSQDLLAACAQLKSLGFRIALTDLLVEPEVKPMLLLADCVKVNLRETLPQDRGLLISMLRGTPAALLAEGVDSHADYEQARSEGFTLFEGYYFCEPVPHRNRRPPANQMLRIDILKALQRDPMDMHHIGELVKRDGPLAFQLLRLVNSPLWAVRQAVESIEVALLEVGETTFRRIATLAIASEFNGDQPAELLCMAMVRGRFCEAAASARGLAPFGQYLLGLLSLLPAMQGQPMIQVAPALPLAQEIRDALLGKKNSERALLGWLESYERGDWTGCDAAAHDDELSQPALQKIYIEAVAWAEAALRT
jgi:EAL and modified HD-GYP domain-containing signal transduction protein